jgi:hypothetical protein
MHKFLLLFLLNAPLFCLAQSKKLSIDHLLAISTISPKNMDNYMKKNGFISASKYLDNNINALSFYEKLIARKKKDSIRLKLDTVVVNRRLDTYKKVDTLCYALQTTSKKEYQDGQIRLIREGFFYDANWKPAKGSKQLFQKKNIVVLASVEEEDKTPVYKFLLQKIELPGAEKIRFADDLLQFDSHELLVSFFGESNVKKDQYYFTEKELKKCSILFGNTGHQAVFVWKDENNMRSLSYIIISGVLPTVSSKEYEGNLIHNEWVLKNGVACGITLKDLVELNKKDLYFFGNKSEFPLLVVSELFLIALIVIMLN